MRHQRPSVGIDAVVTTFDMTFAGHESGEEVITTQLLYSIHEPFSIRARFSTPVTPAVEWVLARELLREGVAIPSGIGDVRFFPTDHGMLLELGSVNGRAVLQGPIEPVVEFVQRIYELVPSGRESDYFAIDAELELFAALWANPSDGSRRDPA